MTVPFSLSCHCVAPCEDAGLARGHHRCMAGIERAPAGKTSRAVGDDEVHRDSPVATAALTV
jgi:hypothetical protein